MLIKLFKHIFRSKYTRTDRYTYVDPDYALSPEQAYKRDANNMKYKRYIDDLRNTRKSQQRDRYNIIN